MIDLSKALNCIQLMKQRGTYEGQKVGILRRNFYGMVSKLTSVPEHIRGQVVLFRDELEPSDSSLRLGEYAGVEQKRTGTVTIEFPLCQEDIDREVKRKSLIMTTGTAINVPRNMVEEVIL